MATKEKVEEVKKSDVAFSPEQLSVIQQMLEEVKNSSSNRGSEAISMYNQRDPKSIESVNVRRIDGKFVVGFENFQNDPFKKTPKYLIYKPIPERGLHSEPYITLILSTNGVDFEKKEMTLVDYITHRDKYQAKVVNIEIKEIIEDHGFLGSTGEYASAIDERGHPIAAPRILAQTKREERVFSVELPGFEKPQEFISDYLA